MTPFKRKLMRLRASGSEIPEPYKGILNLQKEIEVLVVEETKKPEVVKTEKKEEVIKVKEPKKEPIKKEKTE